MRGFEDYYNIPSLPKAFLKDLEDLNKRYKKKYPHFEPIEAKANEWPEGNVVRLYYGDMILNEISEIDTELQKLFKKYELTFELYSGAYTAGEDG
jgi:hypothetical protein